MFLDKLPARPCIIPSSAMILAAGRGERMLPLTERIPKPMLVISGSTILDRAIEHLFKTGIKKIVINTSHLASNIEDHVIKLNDKRLFLSSEKEPLETGGGVKKALPLLGKEAFYLQYEMSLSDAYDYTSKVMTENSLADDAKEGIASFLEKRDPIWKDE